MTILKITEERRRCSFSCSLTLPQAAITRALLTLRSSRHATANTAASRKAHLQETRLQSSSYGSSLACPTLPLLASTSRLGSGRDLPSDKAVRNTQSAADPENLPGAVKRKAWLPSELLIRRSDEMNGIAAVRQWLFCFLIFSQLSPMISC